MKKIIQDQSAAYRLEQGYFFVQVCEDGYDFTVYDKSYQEFDGGQMDNPELTLAEATAELLQEYFPDCTYEVMNEEDLLEKVEK